jgi:hypothetical protein
MLFQAGGIEWNQEGLSNAQMEDHNPRKPKMRFELVCIATLIVVANSCLTKTEYGTERESAMSRGTSIG